MAFKEPYELSVKEASELIRKQELSPVDLVRSCIERIEALEERIKAWALVDREGALQAASLCEAEIKERSWRGPLHGIPIGIKDIFYTAGLRTEAGSGTLAGFVPSCDASAVERLKEAGAIILGKTQTTQFACLDPAATRNPWNLDHTPGGSSSGSAAAVAACMCPVALGSQTAGSTLRPAAYNGIVGAKGEHGRVSTYGVVPLSWRLDHVGILARTVEDAAITLQAIAGYDPKDLHSLNAPVPDFLASLKVSKSPRLGLVRGYFFDHADEEMRRHTEEVAERLRGAGASVTEAVLPPDFVNASDINGVSMKAEAAAYHEDVFAEKKDLYRSNIRQLIEDGLAGPVTTYVRALEERLAQRAKLTPLLLNWDALVTPGATGAAPEGLESTGNPAMQRPWTTIGVPTIALPTGLNRKGLPLGIQLVGGPFAEDRLFAVAWWCEKALGVHLNPPL